MPAQTSTTEVVRSTDEAWVVRYELDDLYVAQRGCVRRVAVNTPRRYLGQNARTGDIDPIVFALSTHGHGA